MRHPEEPAKALAIFAGRGDEGHGGGEDEIDPTRPMEELLAALDEAIGMVRGFLTERDASLDDIQNLSGFARNAAIVNLPNLTFQIIRPTIATLSQKKGPAKATQGLMRHARIATTMDVYQKVIPEAVAEMADAIHEELRKPSTAAAQTCVFAAQTRRKAETARAYHPKIDTREGS